MERRSHGEPSAQRRSDDGVVAVKQNTTLPWLYKRGKLVRMEEVTMAKLLANLIGQLCSNNGAMQWRSTVAAMASTVLRWWVRERVKERK